MSRYALANATDTAARKHIGKLVKFDGQWVRVETAVCDDEEVTYIMRRIEDGTLIDGPYPWSNFDRDRYEGWGWEVRAIN